MQTRDEVRFLKPIPQIWADALKVLSTTASPGLFALLETAAELKMFNNGLAVIAVVNPFYQGLLIKHKHQLQEALTKVTNVPIMIEFVVDNSVKAGQHTGTFADITTDDGASQSASAPASSVSVEQPAQQQAPPPVVQPPTPFQPFVSERVGERPTAPARPADIVAPAFGAAPTLGAAPAGAEARAAARNSLPPQAGRYNNARSVPPPVNRPFDITRSGLNPKNTFASFVVGSNNRFCHSAAVAVSQSPGQNYNPLFLYGGVGLGKTHLMQAIGHAILEANPNVQVRYVTCEKFTNDLINSIKDKSTVEFRKRYRNIDVLLIDDIQFIEGKESTQEEFFHTFNALKEAGKQIILTSDRPPKAFSRLEERLKSRFEWGLTSDIQAPDYETRLAILRKKCDIDGINIDDGTLNHIAKLFTTNIRELEGALIRVNAYASLTGEKVDQLSLHTILTPAGTPVAKPSLTVDAIIRAVADHYKLDPIAIKGAKRSADLTLPRHIAMHLTHDLMRLSFPRIGEAFGNRKHTSALYAINKVKELIVEDPTVTAAISQIRRQLGH